MSIISDLVVGLRGGVVLVGREVVARSMGRAADCTVETVGRSAEYVVSAEPADKGVVALRVDDRDALVAPCCVSFESGQARQLAATLTRAADIIDELGA